MAASLINGSVDRSYFSNPRDDIEPLLPGSLGRVLDVGCGTGETLAWLKAAHGAEETTGIELHHGLAPELRRNADIALIGPAEDADPPGLFDTILFLDVLEHMADPWSVVTRYSRMLRPGGVMIASIPNVVHCSVLKMMLRHRDFSYGRSGILDRTHLRFFARRSAEQLLASGGLQVDAVVSMLGPRERFLTRIVASLPGAALEPFITYQYLVRAGHGPTSGVHRMRRWLPNRLRASGA